MKYLIQACCTALFLAFAFPLHSAIHITGPAPGHEAVKGFEKESTPKRTVGQRLAVKYLQKKAKKQRKKKRTNKRRRADTDEAADKLSTLALIFGAGAWPLVFIPIIGALAFACAITGIVLGVMALTRGGDKLKATLGIVLGSLFLVFATVAVILLFFTLLWVS